MVEIIPIGNQEESNFELAGIQCILLPSRQWREKTMYIALEECCLFNLVIKSAISHCGTAS
jgi:hypothetical protein